MSGWPVSARFLNCIDGTTRFDAAFGNGIQDAITGIYSGGLSLKALVIDGTGATAETPTAGTLTVSGLITSTVLSTELLTSAWTPPGAGARVPIDGYKTSGSGNQTIVSQWLEGDSIRELFNNVSWAAGSSPWSRMVSGNDSSLVQIGGDVFNILWYASGGATPWADGAWQSILHLDLSGLAHTLWGNLTLNKSGSTLTAQAIAAQAITAQGLITADAGVTIASGQAMTGAQTYLQSAAQGTAPSIGGYNNAGIGNSPSSSVVSGSTAMRGSATITTGGTGTPAAGGTKWATLSFGQTLPSAPFKVQIAVPKNAAWPVVNTYLYADNITTTGFDIYCGGGGSPGNGTVYPLDWLAIG